MRHVFVVAPIALVVAAHSRKESDDASSDD
jgi:hypothetical protein